MANEFLPARPTTPALALDRRSFLRALGAGAAVTAADLRHEAAQLAFDRPYPDHVCNGEEDDYAGTRIANFSKGLPHNDLGEVDPAAYNALLVALASGDPA